MLAEYNVKLPVARSTAHRWLAAADIRRGWATQNYYNDNHQAPLVIKQRDEYIPVRKELELRQPLWIQLTGPQRAAMEREATEKYQAKQAEEEERKRTRKPCTSTTLTTLSAFSTGGCCSGSAGTSRRS